MKRIFLLAPLVLVIAACSSARHVATPNFTPPLPPPLPQAARPATPHVTVPSRVPSAGPVKMATVSAYMDNQERDFRQNLRRYAVIIARRGDVMVLNLGNNQLFQSGMQLSANGHDMLATLAILLRRYDHSAVNVSGYTDTSGSPEQNIDVSQRRAKVVSDALAKDGVIAARLSAQGFGENNLRVRTGDNVAEPRNRRIEIRITPTPVG